ncbi:MAG: GNAT family N-acetyltransferase [Pseudomonadota bacterium]
MTQTEVEITVLPSLADISAEQWDLCAGNGPGRARDPFTTHRFLLALERSGSVGTGTGWQPHYLVARAQGQVIAVAPLYLKNHSQGEYIFDHNWAHAYENAGARYYPKLQMAVPFTPATGRRFLTRPGWEETGTAALVEAAVSLTVKNHLSSLHITFCTGAEAKVGAQMGLLSRTTQQFHWRNADFGSFDDFLATLTARKRKNIRKERKQANAFGGDILCLTGDQIAPAHWDAFWLFYQDTGARKWGTPYLTRAFFDEAHETMRDDMLMVLAQRDGRAVAGALNFIGQDVLYGRYWGCLEHHPALHFELCYYRAIEFAIAHGLSTVEAGAQGEHKLARGYLPVETHSLHWMPDEGFRDAIARYLKAERDAVNHEIEVLTEYGPFRNSKGEDHD